MITMRTTLLLGSSIALSAVAAFIANSWIQNELNQGEQLKASMEQVVVASMKIPYGLEIGDTHIKVKEVPKGTAPAGAFSDAEQVLGTV